MKTSSEDFMDLEVDDYQYEDWEFEYTNNLVEEFLEETVIPLMENFDFAKDDENYIPGVASFTLFTRLVEMLTENGWNVEQLKNTVEEFGNQSNFETKH